MKILGEMTDEDLLKMIGEKEPGYITVTAGQAKEIYKLPELTGKDFKELLERAYPGNNLNDL